MWKIVGISGAKVLHLRHFSALPYQNQNIDTAHKSQVDALKENADW